MLDFARGELHLGEVQPDGATNAEHYASLFERGIVPEALQDLPECPEDLFYLWEYFLRMNMRRSSGTISSLELKAWAELHGVTLAPYEVEVLDQLEQVYQDHERDLQKQAIARMEAKAKK